MDKEYFLKVILKKELCFGNAEMLHTLKHQL